MSKCIKCDVVELELQHAIVMSFFYRFTLITIKYMYQDMTICFEVASIFSDYIVIDLYLICWLVIY